MAMATEHSGKDIQVVQDGVSSLYTDYDDDVSLEDTPTEDLDALSGKTFTFNHANFPWRDVVILEDNNSAYHAEISAFTPNKPDITLRRNNANGELVGQAHFRWSLSIKAGVGPSDIDMQWTNMKRGGIFYKRNYVFEWIGNSYSLRRTHSTDNGVSGIGKMMLNHMKLTDNKTGKLVAVYISQPGVARKRGTLRLAKDVSAELEILSILGIAAWREKAARSHRKTAGGGGGGGSG